MGLFWNPRDNGEAIKSTRHLSMCEKGAYIDLTDFYYTERRPLSTDMERLYNMCNAKSDEEESAIRYVLSYFFTIKDDKYHHIDIDEEIQKGLKISKKCSSSAKKSHKSRKENTAIAKASAEAIAKASAEAIAKASAEAIAKAGAIADTLTLTLTTTEVKESKKKSIKKESACVSEEMLLELWNEYPNIRPRGSRKDFYQSVQKQISKGVHYETIQDGIKRYARNCNETGGYNKHASRWIDKGAWDADYSTTEAAPKNGIREELERSRREIAARNNPAQPYNPNEGESGIFAQITAAQAAREGV